MYERSEVNKILSANPYAFVHPKSVSSLSSLNSALYYRLPKFSLPSFSDNFLQWQSCWNSYGSTIHSNIDLTYVQKLTFQTSKLEGSSASVIEGFPITNASYACAIELSNERFSRLQQTAHTAMHALLKLPVPLNKEYHV